MTRQTTTPPSSDRFLKKTFHNKQYWIREIITEGYVSVSVNQPYNLQKYETAVTYAVHLGNNYRQQE